MNVTNVDKKSFEKVVLNSKKTVLVDFWAPWCNPCRMMSPVVDEFADEHSEFTVVKVNVDEEQELAEKYGIVSIPSLVVFKNGEIVDRSMGFRPKEALEEWLK